MGSSTVGPSDEATGTVLGTMELPSVPSSAAKRADIRLGLLWDDSAQGGKSSSHSAENNKLVVKREIIVINTRADGGSVHGFSREAVGSTTRRNAGHDNYTLTSHIK